MPTLSDYLAQAFQFTPERPPIVVSKIGADHSFQGVNRQDFGLAFGNVKLALDGCSSGKFSEVGVGLFAQSLARHRFILPGRFPETVHDEFSRLTHGLRFTDAELFENFCFTILAVVEVDDKFLVFSCGDGYILTITKDDQLEVKNLDEDYDNYPPYYVYNFIAPENLSGFKDGVKFKVQRFKKPDIKNVGIATDGYRFVERLGNADKMKLEEALIAGKRGRVGQVINRNASLFRDDVTIVL